MTIVGLFHGYVTGIGGGERVVSSLARGLLKDGHHVKIYVVVLGSAHPASEIFKKWMPPEAEIILIRLMKERKFKKFSLYQNLEDFMWYQNSVKTAEQSSDIIVQTGGGLQPLVRTKRRRISYCQDLWQASSIDDKYHGALWKLYSLPYELIMKRKLAILKNAKHLLIVANSNYIKQHLLTTWNFDNSDVSVVYPPVDILKWQSNADNEVPIRHNIVNVGRFHPIKNHELMFDIVKGLSATLTLIGNTISVADKSYLKKLQENAPTNVRFLENVNEGVVLEELHKTKVYLHSGHETFGLTIVEAIAAGCIPVVPDHSAHKETVPFPELRYNSIPQARNIIQDALLDKFDYLQPKLKSHIKQFDEPNFQSKMKNVIDSML